MNTEQRFRKVLDGPPSKELHEEARRLLMRMNKWWTLRDRDQELIIRAPFSEKNFKIFRSLCAKQYKRMQTRLFALYYGSMYYDVAREAKRDFERAVCWIDDWAQGWANYMPEQIVPEVNKIHARWGWREITMQDDLFDKHDDRRYVLARHIRDTDCIHWFGNGFLQEFKKRTLSKPYNKKMTMPVFEDVIADFLDAKEYLIKEKDRVKKDDKSEELGELFED